MNFINLFYAGVVILLSLFSKASVLLNSRIKTGRNIRIRGWAYIHIVKKAHVEIGNNTMLNSSNFLYHINMHGPVKLLLDMPGAFIKIGENCRIHGTCIHAKESIIIGNSCLIAANTQIMDNNAHDLCMDNPSQRIHTSGKTKPVVIGDNVWIGANVIVLPGVNIGSGSVISAGSVVSSDIPQNVIASGNPAQFKILQNER